VYPYPHHCHSLPTSLEHLFRSYPQGCYIVIHRISTGLLIDFWGV
jgi:hypothetical protein